MRLPTRTTLCELFSMEERVDGRRGRALLPCRGCNPVGTCKRTIFEQLIFLHIATCSLVRCYCEVDYLTAEEGDEGENDWKERFILNGKYLVRAGMLCKTGRTVFCEERLRVYPDTIVFGRLHLGFVS